MNKEKTQTIEEKIILLFVNEFGFVDYHHGDCTDEPQPCMRCSIENILPQIISLVRTDEWERIIGEIERLIVKDCGKITDEDRDNIRKLLRPESGTERKV